MLKHVCAYILMIGALLMLCLLGTWQLQRLAWKETIIRDLKNAYSHPGNLNWDDLAQDQFMYGQIDGHIIAQKTVFLGPKTNANSEVGYHAIIPVQTDKGIILGNFGWVRTQEIQAPQRKEVSVTGLVRRPEWNTFTPNNSPENNIWTKPDISEMAQALNLKNVAPNMIYVEKVNPALTVFEQHEKGWLPRNKHAQYAGFWFFMAFLMGLIIGGYSYRLMRKDL